jgi:membrane protein DedA with SNARE-associated domain
MFVAIKIQKHGHKENTRSEHKIRWSLGEMPLESLIATYSYPALFAGTVLEGEAVLIIAGFLAYRGYLELPYVILVAFLGAFLGDQLFFQIGRRVGAAFLEKRPN